MRSIPQGLQGARVALLEELLGDTGAERPVRTVIEGAVEEMTAQGAEAVELDETDFGSLLQGASLIGLEFKFNFDAYLAKTPGAPVRSLAELVERGLYHQVLGSGALRASLDVESLDTDEYCERLGKRDTLRAAIEALLDEHDLTALIYPTIRRTARPIGEGQPGTNCSLSAISGLPAITVPAGYAADGMPVGLEMIGREFAEADLIRLAYAYEQATLHRRPPESTPSLIDPPGPVVLDVRTETATAGGIDLRGRLVFDRATRMLSYSVSVYGVTDDDLLFTHIHRSTEGAAGPVVHLLGGRGRPRVSGRLALSAAGLGPSPRRRALRRRAHEGGGLRRTGGYRLVGRGMRQTVLFSAACSTQSIGEVLHAVLLTNRIQRAKRLRRLAVRLIERRKCVE